MANDLLEIWSDKNGVTNIFNEIKQKEMYCNLLASRVEL
jgi:hypothetical protein